jgi:hypothetical protein
MAGNTSSLCRIQSGTIKELCLTKTNGRIESIDVSLPPNVQWVYDHHPSKKVEEERIKVLEGLLNWTGRFDEQLIYQILIIIICL